MYACLPIHFLRMRERSFSISIGKCTAVSHETWCDFPHKHCLAHPIKFILLASINLPRTSSVLATTKSVSSVVCRHMRPVANAASLNIYAKNKHKSRANTHTHADKQIQRVRPKDRHRHTGRALLFFVFALTVLATRLPPAALLECQRALMGRSLRSGKSSRAHALHKRSTGFFVMEPACPGFTLYALHSSCRHSTRALSSAQSIQTYQTHPYPNSCTFHAHHIHIHTHTFVSIRAMYMYTYYIQYTMPRIVHRVYIV